MLLLRQIKPDVVHTWLVQMDVLGGAASRVMNVKWILREPSSLPAYPSTWKHRARVRIARYASAIVSNSTEGDLYWSGYYPDKRRCIIRNAVPIDAIDSVGDDGLIRRAGVPRVPRILYVGRLKDYKNVDKLISAVERLHALVPVRLIICGEGPMYETLRKQVASAGLADAVELRGFLNDRAVWALMKQSDVFCSLSDFEGLPNTVLEAMACGVPLVLSDISAHRELLDADSALFVIQKDVRAVATALLSSISDRNAACARARIAKEKSMQFTIRNMALRYLDLYSQVIQAGVSQG